MRDAYGSRPVNPCGWRPWLPRQLAEQRPALRTIYNLATAPAAW